GSLPLWSISHRGAARRQLGQGTHGAHQRRAARASTAGGESSIHGWKIGNGRECNVYVHSAPRLHLHGCQVEFLGINNIIFVKIEKSTSKH
ncbi:Os07g0653300, partial [Oryza sativa Japonica Group]